VAGAAITAVVVAVHGWGGPVYEVLLPFVVLLAAAYYLWGGRDSDAAAVLRREPDERQLQRRLRVQALVGRVMSLAAGVAYLVAFSERATLWPFGIALALPGLAAAAGWVLYRDPA
jgi:hypothetical protein